MTDKEPNLYRGTLENCRDTLIPDCRDTVHEGVGTPASPIATPIGAGGWECTEATAWLVELTDQCTGILGAFDDAIEVVRKEVSHQPAEVDVPDWRGLNWPRSWSMEQRLR